MMEFHVSRASRDKYQFDQVLFSQNGNVIFANFQAARQFAAQINAQKKTGDKGYVSPGQINALGLIDEIFHLIVSEYYQEYGKDIREALYTELIAKLGKEKVESSLEAFLNEFPPVDVYQGSVSLKDYLAGETAGVSHYQLALEELLMLWLTNANPAAEPYSELFDDSKLQKTTAYDQIIDGIKVFFKHQPVFGPENQDLVTMLRTPAIVVPQSLSGQLEYIRQHWAKYLGKFLYRLLGSLDLIKEEERAIFTGPGPTLVPDYSGQDLEVERFSPDSDWMPRVVMIAKNTFVWLNQLSKQFQRPIERLDQVPDETLDQLARWGFTGLWLIGLWERSEASRRIKQLCGNPDAVSSAYSLACYQIAERLGGEAAYQNLSQRAGQRGIRLASDMVPNHMGIDSDWVYEHPDWFIGQGYSPFPNYTFNGPDLSQNPDISINIEDHYYTRSDAAVVFKRYDHRNGDTRFIYHGNDGTSMPWNDTAQLNYLNPEVREAVIQTILSVARKFPIIRFDAAMTLTKKHYQRLWFPQPGTGGDIPSRAEHAMTKEEFDRAMPNEFWREVVERVAKEVPDTLLLAEAFWLMEGYFVRTLGMHRVYNSAFMNMLRNEENDKYRQLIKNTLVYDPQILKRYVNFMNNPDEKTAVEQFGKGDKYFGICTVMITMPGLPMFGHGQIEGYAEKYGMEYYRPYWDETPDYYLIHRHETDVFPLVHRRRVFANVDNFRLYDFFTPSGSVDENVFAYSNTDGGQAALVVYNNRFGSTSGWIKTSVPYLVKGSENPHLETSELADALQFRGDSNTFVTFRDYIDKLEYIRSVQDIREHGLFFALDAYKHHVFMDFRLVSGREYEELNAHLHGRGVSNLDVARREIVLGPVLQPLGQVINPTNLNNLIELAQDTENPASLESLLRVNLDLMRQAGYAMQRQGLASGGDMEAAGKQIEKCLRQILDLENLDKKLGLSGKKIAPKLSKALQEIDPRAKFVLLIWNFLSNLAGPANEPENTQTARRFVDEEPTSRLVTETLKGLGFGDYEAYKACQAIKWMLINTNWLTEKDLAARDLLEKWLQDEQFKEYLELNEYNQVFWFNKEKFETMLWYMHIAAILRYASDPSISSVEQVEAILRAEPIFDALQKAFAQSEFRLDQLQAALD
ncbi:MAG: alpha-amylase [Anaerolineaceae bacterium]|nr:alpha-amylase [Anaerolineaceae bacterium]